MSDNVSWAVELSVKPGQLDNFKELVEEMVQSTRNEPNTLAYEWFLGEDTAVVTSTKPTPTLPQR